MGRLVKGTGPIPCDVMIIGEAPGATEDKLGFPFVGTAGNTLNVALAKAGLDRDTCFVTNVYKERPPGNRTPTFDELWSHKDLLVDEYKKVQPKHVLVLGNTAFHFLTNIKDGITKGRGRVASERAVFDEKVTDTVYATIHPSACRSREMREIFEADIAAFSKIVQTSRKA